MYIDRKTDKGYVVLIYSRILLSDKKNKVMPFNMDGPRDCHTEWSKPDKDEYHMISFICGI